ncbi:uncharacterized protein METZ01_LOCUS58222 [marine metagenome]|uniref:Uncharacterized protein n=1 Tax=marine metagenome TaxID=408172 RepID=A0A381SPY3_9ZZZZ
MFARTMYVELMESFISFDQGHFQYAIIR